MEGNDELFDGHQPEPKKHYPKKRDRFEFDEEVAEVFDDMAVRSIPLYDEVHALHAKIIVDDMCRIRSEYQGEPENVPTYRILDVGSSTGRLYRALGEEIGNVHDQLFLSDIEFYAIDPSQPMIDRIKERCPNAKVYTIAAAAVGTLGVKFNAVAMHYVLQFIPNNVRHDTMVRLHNSMKRYGLLLFAQKEQWNSEFADSATEYYIEMRVANGYSMPEIEAKTKALKTVMSTAPTKQTERMLVDIGFSGFQDTTRLGLFNSMVARSRG